MKLTKFLILLIGITVMFSCKSKKEAQEVAQAPQVEQREGRRGGAARQGGERGDRGDWQARQKERQAKLFADLGLSEAQQTKMESIQQGTQSKMQAMRAEMRDGTSSREAMREKMQAIRKSEVDEIKKILTEEQFTKYEKILAERQSRRGERGGRGGGRGGM